MAMLTPGGVIRGYWATGRFHRAMPPTSVMSTLRTVAKIGRSMKNFESMRGGPSGLRRPCGLPARARPLLALARRLLVGPRAGGRRGRRLGERRHRPGLRLDRRVGAGLLDAADEHEVVRLQPLDDLAQAVFLERARRHPAIL